MSTPCLFLDRDGILNQRPDPERYVTSKEQFVFLSDILDILHLSKARGYPSVVVTNQRGIALGYMSQEDVDEIHATLRQRLALEGLVLMDILVCPFDDDHHPWRKPNPGMLLEAAKRHDLDLARSWMIGDHLTDIYAGKSAGCRTILVDHDDPDGEAEFLVQSVLDILPIFKKHLEPAAKDTRDSSE